MMDPNDILLQTPKQDDSALFSEVDNSSRVQIPLKGVHFNPNPINRSRTVNASHTQSTRKTLMMINPEVLGSPRTKGYVKYAKGE